MNQSIKSDRSLGENIKTARSNQNMTQEQLAANLQVRGCDMSRGTLAKIEAGIRHISVPEINAIKEILDMQYEDFFSEKEI